jgi:hypothetical protein
MRVSIALLFLLVSTGIFGQKFRLNTSIGSSVILWHENQNTVDLGAELSFQKPQQKHKIFAALKTMGNIYGSNVNRSHYTPFDKENTQIGSTEELQAHYRGGLAEGGIIFNTPQTSNSPKLSPSLSYYSKSIARKISASTSRYIEEEKYSLHGISAGMGLLIPGKTNLNIHVKIMEPFYEKITFYGENVGVPYKTRVSGKAPNFMVKVDISRKTYGLGMTLEILNFGAADNPKSKSISASQAIIPSTLLTYFF